MPPSLCPTADPVIPTGTLLSPLPQEGPVIPPGALLSLMDRDDPRCVQGLPITLGSLLTHASQGRGFCPTTWAWGDTHGPVTMTTSPVPLPCPCVKVRTVNPGAVSTARNAAGPRPRRERRTAPPSQRLSLPTALPGSRRHRGESAGSPPHRPSRRGPQVRCQARALGRRLLRPCAGIA